MPLTRINTQDVLNKSLKLEDVQDDFLQGNNWNITNGNENATIIGLRDGENKSDASTINNIKTHLDRLAFQNYVINMTTTDPSGLTPTNGDRYIVGNNSTGDWSGHDNEIAEFRYGNWVFIIPQKGYQLYDQDTDLFYVWDGNNWTNLSSYVSNSTSYIFQNALTENSGTVELGGVLNKNTEINGYEGAYYFKFKEIDYFQVDTTSYNQLHIEYNNVYLSGGNYSDNHRSQIKLTNIGFRLTYNDSTHESGIYTDDNNFVGIRIFDNIDHVGLSYSDDYSSNNSSNPRWIPDKAYVDSVAGNAGTYNFINGLTEDTSTNPHNVKFGGSLIEDSSLNLDSYVLNFKSGSGDIIVQIGDVDNGNFSARVQDETQSDYYYLLTVDTYSTRIGMVNNTNLEGFEIDYTDGIIVKSDSKSQGLKYKSDYFTNGSQDDRWIPDWGAVKNYVDSQSNTSPPGNDSEVIFNDNGTWGADSKLKFDKTNSRLYIGDGANIFYLATAGQIYGLNKLDFTIDNEDTTVTYFSYKFNNNDKFRIFPDRMDFYNNKIVNLADPVDDLDGVNKRYVDTTISTSFNFTNGLNVDTSVNPYNVKFGGTLIENTNIDGASYDLNMTNFGNFIVSSENSIGNVSVGNSGVIISGYDNTNNTAGRLKAVINQAILEVEDTSSLTKSMLIVTNNNGIIISDGLSSKGLSYDADYHDNWTDHSIPDKIYVDIRARSTVIHLKSTGNIDISSAPSTIDGVTPNNGDLILLLDQTTGTEDGIYQYNGANNPLTRLPWFNNGTDMRGFLISVIKGNTNGDKVFLITNDTSATIGTDDLEYKEISKTDYNFTNGLTRTGSTVKWGGNLTENTFIVGGSYNIDISANQIDFSASQQFTAEVGNSNFNIGLNKTDIEVISGDDDLYVEYMPAHYRATADDGNVNNNQISLTPTEFKVETYDGTDTINILTSPTSVRLLVNNGTNDLNFELSKLGSVIIEDSINSLGMKYKDDYSINGVNEDRWIPDYAAVKSYVNSQIGSSVPGNNTEVIFNDNGNWGTDPHFKYNKNVYRLYIYGDTFYLQPQLIYGLDRVEVQIANTDVTNNYFAVWFNGNSQKFRIYPDRIDVYNLNIKNLADPVDDQDAVNKRYLESQLPTVPGSNTEIIFNDNGDFGSDSRFTWDKTNGIFRVDTQRIRFGIDVISEIGDTTLSLFTDGDNTFVETWSGDMSDGWISHTDTANGEKGLIYQFAANTGPVSGYLKGMHWFSKNANENFYITIDDNVHYTFNSTDFSVHNKQIKDVADPTDNLDAVNLQYFNSHSLDAPGIDKQVIFNKSGNFDTDANFIYDYNNTKLTIGNIQLDGAGGVISDTYSLSIGSAGSGFNTYVKIANHTIAEFDEYTQYLYRTLDMNSNHIIELADPVDPQDAVNLRYLDRFKDETHSYVQSTNLASGWYTVAVVQSDGSTGERAVARFGIREVSSGHHQNIVFYASHDYARPNSNKIIVLTNTWYDGGNNPPIRYIRIKQNGTYDGAVLQIYIDSDSDGANSITFFKLGDNIQTDGWLLKDFVDDSTDPGNVGNYSSMSEIAKVDLWVDSNQALIFNAPLYIGDLTQQYKVLTENDISDTSDLIHGSGNATQIAFFDNNHSIASDSELYWDNSGKKLGIGTLSPDYKLDVIGGSIRTDSTLFSTRSISSNSGTYLNFINTGETYNPTLLFGYYHDTTGNIPGSTWAIRISNTGRHFALTEYDDPYFFYHVGRKFIGIKNTDPQVELDVTGRIKASQNIRIGNSRDINIGTGIGIELGGSTSSAVLSTQDGNGRIQLKWNASYGTSETFLVGDENAGRWEFDPQTPNDQLFTIDFANGSGVNAGDSITWSNVLRIGNNTFTYKGNDVLTESNYPSYLDDRYVNVTGDTMTGHLNINGVDIDGSVAKVENTTTNTMRVTSSSGLNLQTDDDNPINIEDVSSGLMMSIDNHNGIKANLDVTMNTGLQIHFDNGTDLVSLRRYSDMLNIITPNGYTRIGANNGSWSHFYTDRNSFWFNKTITSGDGRFNAYANYNLRLQTNFNTRMTIFNSSGNVGIGSEDTSFVDEKLTVHGYIKSSSGFVIDRVDFSIPSNTTDYFRIATGKNRVGGRWKIKYTVSGQHGTLEFYAGIHYGDASPYNVILYQNDYYGSAGVLRIRLLEKGTYDDVYLDIQFRNNNSSSPMNVRIEYLSKDYDGWIVNDPPTSGATVPSGYSNHNIYVTGRLFRTQSHQMLTNGDFRNSRDIICGRTFVASSGAPGISTTIRVQDGDDWSKIWELTFEDGILTNAVSST